VSAVPLFVYGSLKRGFRHESVLGSAELVRTAWTAPGYRLVRYGEYPALAREHGGIGRVSGELYLVDPSDVPGLDEFEDVPKLYQRELVLLDDGSHVHAYVISPAVAMRYASIPSGTWQEHE
jgi:gamma-glutamylcyclotransferase (GGCT)/AIG2-like uncharacterized protein YtfP